MAEPVGYDFEINCYLSHPMADEFVEEISDLALLDFRVFFEDEESEKKEDEEESKEDTKDDGDGPEEISEGSSGNDHAGEDKSNNSEGEKEEDKEEELLSITFPFDERFKTTEDYETIATLMRVLRRQKEQAERDLEILKVEKEKALEDPASFVEDLMQKKGDRLPKRQVVAKMPKIDIIKYNRLKAIPTIKEEPSTNGTAAADPNAPAAPVTEGANGTSAVSAPSLEVPGTGGHHAETNGTSEHKHTDLTAHLHDEHAMIASPAHDHGHHELNGHDPHAMDLTDKALIDTMNLLQESTVLESGSIHPVDHAQLNGTAHVPTEQTHADQPNGTPSVATPTATADPAPTTNTVAATTNTAPTGTTPAPTPAAPGDKPAAGAANPTGEVKEKKKVFNRLWTPEEQRKLERLLEEYPEEIIASHRWEKIARALGNRSPKQVASRVQKYFIKLAKAGLPVPGKIPNLESKKKPATKPSPQVDLTNPNTITIHTRDVEYYVPPVVKMDEDDEVPQPTVVTLAGKTVPRKRKAESGTGEQEHTAKKPKIKEEPVNGGREVIIRVLNQPEAVHLGYKCDSCGLEPIVGPRWSCEDCTGDDSVDLCKYCIGKKFETKTHKKGHKLRKIEEVEKSPYYVADGAQGAGDLKNFAGLPYLDPNYMPV